MTSEPDKPQDKNGKSNGRVAVICIAFVAGMVGMSYAAVPFYEMFCRVTGYGGTTQRVDQYSDRVLDQKVTIRFDANTSSGLPWKFEPVARDITIKIGETAQAHYTAQNISDKPTAGRATFNVTPELAGGYFNKVECFCFTDTTLQPGETLDMPVVFYVDPDIVNVPELKDVKTITLSYTFFPIEGAKPVANAPQAGNLKTNDNTDGNFGG